MDYGEHLKCIVCREVKTNPQESKCCHKLYCQDCIKRMTSTDVCSICQQRTDFSENTFASRLINIKLGKDNYSGRNNSIRTIINKARNYLMQKNSDSASNHPDTDDTDLLDAFKITVLNLEDRRINIIVEKSDTIKILKLKFQQKDGTAPEHQRLIFQGKQLEDHHTVSHYKIRKDSVIHFVKRYNGS